MTAKVRLTFLPVFLTLLSVAFAAALAYRVRSYRAMEAAAPGAPASSPSAAPAADAPAPAPAPADSTIVEAAPAGQSAMAAAPTLTREQRYRELLAMGNTPESAAVKTAVEAQQQQLKPAPPSAAARVVQPVAKAATGGPKPTQSAPTPQPPAQPSTPSAADGAKSHADDSDPNSDSLPPQLLAVEFVPPQVRDGEETTLIITATDNLSGIRGISGTLTSPTGKALQGFAQQRDGESNHYVSRITIPKDAEEGTWKISFLNMSDNATNMTTLSYVQGSIPPNAVLRVVSARSDSVPPTLRSVSIARRAMHTGEQNTLYIETDDDKSGVHLVSAVFVSPSRQARLGFGCTQAEGITWQCAITPPECLDCGEWQLEQIQMQDNAQNYKTVTSAQEPMIAAVRLNIAGATCDNTPPALQSLTLDKSVVFMNQGDRSITVRVVVTDDSCGVGGVSGQISGPGTNAGTFFAFSPEGPNAWVGTFRFNPNSPRGIWRVQSVTVNDKGQNLRTYPASDPALAPAQFTVK